MSVTVRLNTWDVGVGLCFVYEHVVRADRLLESPVDCCLDYLPN